MCVGYLFCFLHKLIQFAAIKPGLDLCYLCYICREKLPDSHVCPVLVLALRCRLVWHFALPTDLQISRKVSVLNREKLMRGHQKDLFILCNGWPVWQESMKRTCVWRSSLGDSGQWHYQVLKPSAVFWECMEMASIQVIYVGSTFGVNYSSDLMSTGSAHWYAATWAFLCI